MSVIFIIIFLLSGIVSYFCTIMVKRVAYRLKILDCPRGLKTHKKPTPYLGGVAIFLGFMVAVLFSLIVMPESRDKLRELIGVLTGGFIILMVGLVDDIKPMTPGIKVLGQIAAVVILMMFRVHVDFFYRWWYFAPFSLLWMLVVINSFNLIDVHDGLAAGIAVIAVAFFMLISIPTERIFVMVGAMALAGSALGFLRFNYPPSSIFMGDSGSLFLGFIIGALAMGCRYTYHNVWGFYSPLLILIIPFLDLGVIIIARIRKRMSIFKGSPDHLAIRLRSSGFSKRAILDMLYLLSIIFGFCGLWAIMGNAKTALAVYAVSVAAIAGLAVFFLKLKSRN